MSELNWNDRYSESDYIYGSEPNTFLKQNAKLILNPVISVAEGEGRNAVFLASLGLNTHAVDGSEVALQKANELAKIKKVNITTEIADLNNYKPKKNYYGGIVSIFGHLKGLGREELHKNLVESMKPNGIFLLEAYSENQLKYQTGGPKDLDMLLTCSKVESEFPELEILLLHEIIREVNEGKYHTGLASVIQFIGKKRA